MRFVVFFFHDTATTEIYTLSLHDALPIFLNWQSGLAATHGVSAGTAAGTWTINGVRADRKSTRLNSSHEWISYAVFCLKKKMVHLSHSPGSTPSSGSTSGRVATWRLTSCL